MKPKHLNNKSRLAAMACASIIGSAASSQAAVLWSDNFSGYSDGGLRHAGGGGAGVSGTPGWGGNSYYSGSDTVNVTTGVVEGNGNAFHGLTQSFAATVGATGTLWVAFDWGHDTTNTGGTYGGLTFFVGGSGGAEKALIGNTWDAAGWSVTNSTSGASGVSMVGRKSAAAKITLGGGAGADDTIELWVQSGSFALNGDFNPIVSGPALLTGTSLDLAGVDSIRIMGNNNQTFDNLSITSIPEPSTALLGGLGLLALLRRRR
jgi:uncharacterized protein (TIGR03382 family)